MVSCCVTYLWLSMVCRSTNDGQKLGNVVSEGSCSPQL